MSAFNAFRKPIPVKRPAPGQYINGIWKEGALSSLEIMASVQPASGEDMEILEESRRKTATMRLYTDTMLRSVEEDETNPDIVTLPDGEYEVVKVMPWQNGLISHYKVLVSRKVKA